MTWNYRLVHRKIEDDEDYYGIHEAYYDDKGEVRSITEEPIRLYAESREKLNELLIQMRVTCFRSPVLEYESVGKK